MQTVPSFKTRSSSNSVHKKTEIFTKNGLHFPPLFNDIYIHTLQYTLLQQIRIYTSQCTLQKHPAPALSLHSNVLFRSTQLQLSLSILMYTVEAPSLSSLSTLSFPQENHWSSRIAPVLFTPFPPLQARQWTLMVSSASQSHASHTHLMISRLW
jgi:hypothetical protein